MIKKYIMPNGLTVITCTRAGAPKVSSQIWYAVGSKDERDGERGIAHLLEHMVFKGTSRLSESDINLISSSLSGYTNAFTSYDYTGYLFDFPHRYWEQSLDIFADCMSNCSFKQDHLNSEFKSVIQELKMYRDNYDETLFEALMAAVFFDHPYGKPIIGTLQDISHVTPANLVQFYTQHYTPSRATLVVVGDVTADQVTEAAHRSFGHIPRMTGSVDTSYYHVQDLSACSVALYRDVANASLLFAWVLPGMKTGNDYYHDVLAWILGNGRGSCLYTTLVVKERLAQRVESFSAGMFDYTLFCIRVLVDNTREIGRIKELVAEQIYALQTEGVSDAQLKRAMLQVRMQHAGLFDDTQELAYSIGEYDMATGDERYVLRYIDDDTARVRKKVESLVQRLSYCTMHTGYILPLSECDRERWVFMQQQIDKAEADVLAKRKRATPVEPGLQVHTIAKKTPKPFILPHYETIDLDTGLSITWYSSEQSEKVELILEFPTDHCYDPKQQAGLFEFTCAVLQEGTRSLSAQEFAYFAEAHGISIEVSGNRIYVSVLQHAVAIALELLVDMVTAPRFADDAIERVRKRVLCDLDDFWDDPSQFIDQLAQEQVYGDHPYAQSALGTKDTISHITSDELRDCWRRLITPRGAHLVVVGNIDGKTIVSVCKKIFSRWEGPAVEPIQFPALRPVPERELVYEINRDQVVLGFAGLSVRRMDPAYDALYLFDQLFTGGKKRSMSSYLFELREQTGLFYTIGGSLVYCSDEQPGMVFVRTIVSQEQVSTAEAAIKRVADEAPERLTHKELECAKSMSLDILHESTESNSTIAHMLLFVKRYQLSKNYFTLLDHRIRDMSVAMVSKEAERVLRHQQITVIKIGRV